MASASVVAKPETIKVGGRRKRNTDDIDRGTRRAQIIIIIATTKVKPAPVLRVATREQTATDVRAKKYGDQEDGQWKRASAMSHAKCELRSTGPLTLQQFAPLFVQLSRVV